MKKLLTIILIILIFCAAIAYYIFAIERNYLAVSSAEGHLDTGQKFGVRIGDNYRDADKLLRRNGFRFVRKSSSDYIYLDSGWRKGTVVLEVNKDRVVSIRWIYRFLAP